MPSAMSIQDLIGLFFGCQVEQSRRDCRLLFTVIISRVLLSCNFAGVTRCRTEKCWGCGHTHPEPALLCTMMQPFDAPLCVLPSMIVRSLDLMQGLCMPVHYCVSSDSRKGRRNQELEQDTNELEQARSRAGIHVGETLAGPTHVCDLM